MSVMGLEGVSRSEGPLKSSLIILMFVLVLALVGCGPPTGYSPNPNPNLNLTVRENIETVPSLATSAAADSRAITAEFYVGLPRQDVFDTLGDPDSIFYGNGPPYFTPGVDYDADAYHVYRVFGLSFRIFGDSVREITLLNDDWIASNGLVVGMSRLEMLEVLGDGYKRFETEFKDFYEYDEYAISVEVYHAGDYVGEINIKEGNAQ